MRQSEPSMNLPELDPVIHAASRLRVMVALACLPAGDQITFTRLQEQLGLTSGNLSTHLTKLEEPGYVGITKTFRRKHPVTYVELTPRGRQAFVDYRTALHKLVPP
ncbi:MAG TPA: transcriptional regulator [Pseudonocardiaceae bacterium]|nr:transcriptional regulator [Pseudonocardiaceae bacterium]